MAVAGPAGHAPAHVIVFGADTIHVPADVSTIQGAIQSASNGDTILVSAGTYHEETPTSSAKRSPSKALPPPPLSCREEPAPGAVVKFISRRRTQFGPQQLHYSGGCPRRCTGCRRHPHLPRIPNDPKQRHPEKYRLRHRRLRLSPLVAGNLITGTSGLSLRSFTPCAEILRRQFAAPKRANPAQTIPANGSGIFRRTRTYRRPAGTSIDNTIKDNSSYQSPGGIWLADAGAPLIENNIVANNYSDYNGAILAAGNVAPVIIQNLIYGNISDSTNIFNPIGIINVAISIEGYAPAFGGITSVFAENTVAYNQSLYQSSFYTYAPVSQIAVAYAPTPFPIYNNIVIGEGVQPAFTCAALDEPSDVAPQLSHNDILVTGGGAAPVAGPCAGQMGSDGNISVDPLFASTDFTAPNPFQLQLQSAAVDTGDNNAPDLPSEDILGHPRIQKVKGLPSAIIDLGVYEYPGVPAPPPPPEFTLQVAPSSLNLGASALGQVTVTLTPNSAFTGTVALSCGPLPAALSCSFSPQSIYLVDGVAQTAVLTIAASAQANSSSPHTTNGTSAISGGVLFTAILILPLGMKKRARRFLALSVLALLPLLLSSCASVVLTPQAQPASYSITITASSNSVQSTHNASVQVTVE